MVGGFSITPSVQFYPSFLTRIRQVSISVAFTMLLWHLAVIQPMSAATAETGFIQKSTYRFRFSSEEKSQLPNTQRTTAATTTRLHRHLLVTGSAVGSSKNTDQASRALVGSSPPKCIKKCGSCTPCKSVLVPIHTTYLPATPAEYYPEAWRCQCRGKTYNP